MWFIGVEVEQETSAPPPKKNLEPPLSSQKKKPNGEVLSERIVTSNIDTIRNLRSKRQKYYNCDILNFVLGS